MANVTIEILLKRLAKLETEIRGALDKEKMRDRKSKIISKKSMLGFEQQNQLPLEFEIDVTDTTNTYE